MEEEVCPVCQEPLGQELAMMPCAHQLCLKCHMALVDRAGTGPKVICRLALHLPHGRYQEAFSCTQWLITMHAEPGPGLCTKKLADAGGREAECREDQDQCSHGCVQRHVTLRQSGAMRLPCSVLSHAIAFRQVLYAANLLMSDG